MEFMEDLSLQNLLSRGIITYESGDHSSTIDLVLASEQLAEGRTVCRPFETTYGPDHQPIKSHFQVAILTEEPKPRLAIRSANWEAIRNFVKGRLVDEPAPGAEDFEGLANYLTRAASDALRTHVPRVRPSPYVKRWWSVDLSQLRRAFTHFRNQARAARRGG